MASLLMEGRAQASGFLLTGGKAHQSRQLAEEMRTEIVSPSRGNIVSDPYWALYVHDGRKAIGRAGKGPLIWFKDKADDPRLDFGRTPDRAKDLKKLRGRQLADAVARDEVIFARKVAGVAPTPFFSNTGGMAAFPAEARRIVRQRFEAFIEQALAGTDQEAVIRVNMRA